MADDHRYDWLDNEAVERLLRGEPVDTCRNNTEADGQARADADRLAAALGALAETAPLPDGPLPGEDDAVAAFRAARAGTAARGAAGAPAAHGVRGAGARLGRVVDRPSRLRRPLRAGMVAVLAGCAFGGVAVAAGAGVLPFVPNTAEPRPATSVSAAENGGPDGGVEPELSGRPATPSAGTTGGTRRTGPDGRPDGEREGGSPSPSGGGGHGTAEEPDPDRAPGTTGPTTPDRERGRWLRTVCRQYLAGDLPEIDPDKLRRLERAAGGPAAVRRYCEQVIHKGRPGDGAGQGGSDGDDSGGRGGDGDGGDHDHGGDKPGGEDGGGEDGDKGNGGRPSPPPPPPPPTPTPTEPPPPASGTPATPGPGAGGGPETGEGPAGSGAPSGSAAPPSAAPSARSSGNAQAAAR
ncbi:hypothetical protein [Streptomyces pactum]|uniref:hypothetical protein n=1 Tax=Streptomyces pactum TaxID=68249 RepID=UPI0036F70E6C